MVSEAGTERQLGVTTSRLHPDSRGELQELIQRSDRHDAEPSLSEYKSLRLDGRLDARERVAFADDGSIVGYGQAAWHRGPTDHGHWAAEIVVAPEHRRGPVARVLIESLREESGQTPITLWARAPYVAAAARAAGWQPKRVLLEMRTSLPIGCEDSTLEDFKVATFRVGADEGAWLNANNAAFAGHPENGSMTRRDLEHRIAQSWFDNKGFFLIWDGDDLAGSCWTKIHDDGVGEIYIVGVVPAWEGRGLGRSLVCRGLEYLAAERHLSRAKLFVEADNERAVSLYESMGFTTAQTVEAFEFREPS